MRLNLITAATLALAACSDPALPVAERVQARAAGNAILAISNRGDEAVYVRATDPTVLALQSACSPSTCARVAPGETLRLPYAGIENYDPGDAQASVAWWAFVAESGGTFRETARGSVIADL